MSKIGMFRRSRTAGFSGKPASGSGRDSVRESIEFILQAPGWRGDVGTRARAIRNLNI
jgi:hypothetical protein